MAVQQAAVKSAMRISSSGLPGAALSYPAIRRGPSLDPQYAMIVMVWYFITQYKHSKENIVAAAVRSHA